MAELDPLATIKRRLRSQRLTGEPLEAPADVVTWLGAVQAQEFAEAKWSLGERLRACKESDVERAFSEGEVLRTHLMRPTWHFVARADIRWILRLTAPRVHAASRYWYRKSGLDGPLLGLSHAVLAKALEDGQPRTRPELAEALAGAGIEDEGLRLGYILMHAELEQLICSGPRRRKQHTYMLLDDRAGDADGPSGETAMAELARRYFQSHGPATLRDFAWWSGLKVVDARAGLEAIRAELQEELDDEEQSWFSVTPPPARHRPPKAFLIPMYDELGVAHKQLRIVLAKQPPRDGLLSRPIVIDGLTYGSWKRTLTKREVVVEATVFASLDDRLTRDLEAAVRRLGSFLALSATLRRESVSSC